MEPITLDTGALIGLEAKRTTILKVIESARVRRVPIIAPANAVAEWWRGRSDRRDYVRKMFLVQDIDEEIARAAGEALAWLHRKRVNIDDRVTVDATIMATAAVYGPNLHTGDIGDLSRFEPFFPTVRLFKV